MGVNDGKTKPVTGVEYLLDDRKGNFGIDEEVRAVCFGIKDGKYLFLEYDPKTSHKRVVKYTSPVKDYFVELTPGRDGKPSELSVWAVMTGSMPAGPARDHVIRRIGEIRQERDRKLETA